MAGVAPVIELSRLAFEVLRKDEEFVLCRGRCKDDSSQAASASRLRTLRRALGSEAVEAAENRGRDVELRRDFDETSTRLRVAQSSRSVESLSRVVRRSRATTRPKSRTRVTSGRSC